MRRNFSERVTIVVCCSPSRSWLSPPSSSLSPPLRWAGSTGCRPLRATRLTIACRHRPSPRTTWPVSGSRWRCGVIGWPMWMRYSRALPTSLPGATPSSRDGTRRWSGWPPSPILITTRGPLGAWTSADGTTRPRVRTLRTPPLTPTTARIPAPRGAPRMPRTAHEPPCPRRHRADRPTSARATGRPGAGCSISGRYPDVMCREVWGSGFSGGVAGGRHTGDFPVVRSVLIVGVGSDRARVGHPGVSLVVCGPVSLCLLWCCGVTCFGSRPVLRDNRWW